MKERPILFSAPCYRKTALLMGEPEKIKIHVEKVIRKGGIK